MILLAHQLGHKVTTSGTVTATETTTFTFLRYFRVVAVALAGGLAWWT